MSSASGIVIGGFLAAALLGVHTAPPAEALYGVCINVSYGHGCALANSVKVSDDRADGHSTVLQWKDILHPTRSLWDRNGANNGFTYGSLGNYTTTGFKSRICIGEYGTKSIISCKAWV